MSIMESPEIFPSYSSSKWHHFTNYTAAAIRLCLVFKEPYMQALFYITASMLWQKQLRKGQTFKTNI